MNQLKEVSTTKAHATMASDLPLWAQHLTDDNLIDKVKPLGNKKNKLIPAPPGFHPSSNHNHSNSRSQNKNRNSAATALNKTKINEFQIQKAWQLAFQPAKSVPMNFVMSYMSGTSLQIIPIMTVLMLLSGPLKAIFGIRTAFKPFLDNKSISSQVKLAMVVYILGQCALMFIAVRKLNQMRLIPYTRADWLPWEPPVQYQELKAYVV